MSVYEKFKFGKLVKVDECYLNDEVCENVDTSSIATVISIPADDDLVGIIYDSGVIDFVPQYILEPII